MSDLTTQKHEAEPVAYEHTLHMKLGQWRSVVGYLADPPFPPFGIRDSDYDPSYTVTSRPLYATPPASSLQARVQPWMMACFGPEISADRLERGDRLLEEVFELLQSGDYPRERIQALENYVWSRPVGEPAQEAGGVMITHAAYCLAHGIDMHEAGEAELVRINAPEMIAKIRAKQAAKPVGSALPMHFNDGKAEDRYIDGADLACPHCGGSGHKDDVTTAKGRDIPADATGDMGSDAGGPQPIAENAKSRELDGAQLDAMVVDATSAFNALSAEQQREHRRSQGESWGRAEAELSRRPQHSPRPTGMVSIAALEKFCEAHGFLSIQDVHAIAGQQSTPERIDGGGDA